MKSLIKVLSRNIGLVLKTACKEITNSTQQFRYVDGELIPVTNLVLKQRENIEEYVIKIIKNYFRTTQRAELSIESTLADHGLDSLDSIELAMQIEEDLGYQISAENLSVFHKVKHYVNFIEQTENFKKAYKKEPLP